MDVRHFELQDLLAEALIALEAGDHVAATAAVRRALARVEADWLDSGTGGPRHGPSSPPTLGSAPAKPERSSGDAIPDDDD